AAASLLATRAAIAAEFATPGGPEPGNLDAVMDALHAEGADVELLISFGTSKGGSAGHLAVALRGELAGDDAVYSANFYADRAPEHASGFHTADLMLRIPKKEYLYRTRSTLGEKASFGLDFGEVYKRSVAGVRVFGVPEAERQAIAAYFARMNDDYHARAHDTQYHRGEVRYGYTDLNCAKTIGSAYRFGAGYDNVHMNSAPRLAVRKAATYLKANTPSEMAMQLMREFDARGYRMDVVLYRKYPGSPWIDPHDDKPVAFRDLPNRFPSAISLDFRNDARAYEDYDNLFAMYLLHNLARHAVSVDPETQRLQVTSAEPMPFAPASQRAAADAESDSKGFLRRLLFRPRGHRIGEDTATQPPTQGRTP
ncbi:MAG TPA: hypothetical protein VFJ62_06275, partial [Usitatibacter sp.]|nr:hypothetical protein [Usitatibacter sp.]